VTIPDSAIGQTTTITATYNGSSQSVTFTVVPFLKQLTVPNVLCTTLGGQATIALNGASAIDETVSLVSSNPAVVSIPATVTVPAGQTSVTFPVSTGLIAGPNSSSATITATSHTFSLPAGTVTVNPVVATTLGLSQTQIKGGGSVTGR